jgi:protease-4
MDEIAIIYAQGEILGGEGDVSVIGEGQCVAVTRS